MSKVLGVAAFYHDSSAAFLHEGKIINAVQVDPIPL